MKTFLCALMLLTAGTEPAMPWESPAPTPSASALTSVGMPKPTSKPAPKVVTTPAPTPAATPSIPSAEPQNSQQAVQTAVQAVQLFQVALKLGTAGAMAAAALAFSYLLLFLIDVAVKDHIVPDKYDDIMMKVHGVVAILITVLGYLVTGPMGIGALGAGASLIGAVAAGPAKTVVNAVHTISKNTTAPPDPPADAPKA